MVIDDTRLDAYLGLELLALAHYGGHFLPRFFFVEKEKEMMGSLKLTPPTL